VEQAWHLRQAVKRLDGAGIEMFGIGIMDSSVSEYYPKYVVLNQLEELPKTVMQQLERLLLESDRAA
jgi:cobalamin biosynthesis protein CobT